MVEWVQVYKGGRPAGEPLQAETCSSTEDLESALWRHINTSLPDPELGASA